MITCQNCKLILEPDTVYCPRCGRVLSSAPRKSYAPPDPITQSLLLEARALRDKGAWDQAVDKCMDALKKDPECPDSYVALGEVYEAQGRFEQALQWYQMADSELASLGKPSLELQERIRNLNTKRTSGHQTTGWFDRFVGGTRFSSSMRVVTTAMVGFLVLLILGAVFVIYADKMRDEKMSLSRRTVQNPGGSLSGNQHTPNSGNTVIERRSNPMIVPSPVSDPGNDGDTPERRLTAAVIDDPVVSQRQIAVSDVVIDPRHRQVIIQFRVSRAAGMPTRSTIMADSAAVCLAAYKASPEAAYVTVCALADIPDRTGGYGLTRVFVADTSKESAAGINPSLPPVDLQRMFINPWWDPQIAI